MTLTISRAAAASDFAAFGDLVVEYVDWCRDRCRDEPDFVDRVLSHQSLERELRSLASAYSPPKGEARLARLDGAVAGCGAWRDLGGGVCEMKRLYVPERFRGHHIGRRLSDALVASAKAAGHASMRLDTLEVMREAIAMYEAIGFRRRSPYIAYPDDLARRVVFMELPLS